MKQIPWKNPLLPPFVYIGNSTDLKVNYIYTCI